MITIVNQTREFAQITQLVEGGYRVVGVYPEGPKWVVACCFNYSTTGTGMWKKRFDNREDAGERAAFEIDLGETSRNGCED